LRFYARTTAGFVAFAVSLAAAGSAAAKPKPSYDIYAGDLSRGAVAKLVALGIDRHELSLSKATSGRDAVHVETTLNADQVARLADQGVEMELKEVDGMSATQRATLQAAAGYNVYKKYSGPGGLKEEYEQVARRHPLITKLISIGKTTQGKDIIALKVSLGAPLLKDGLKPSIVYFSAQHAREWITPEMNRRLMHYMVDNYLKNKKVFDLVNTTEMWFVPVSNPDGYDWTFEPGQREWRKNLRDNDGDGEITDVDGVDPNRNFDYKWGYDNEGSSPDPTSLTYRGPSPNSEPESKALDALFKRVRPTMFVNYHSAAELLLYGVGWQVATPTPDDQIGIALTGDDAHPAVPGYDPDIAAELYTTNGEVDSYLQETWGSFGITPEMSTCEDASNSDPNDQWEAEDCGSVFQFPDDEKLIQAEFEKNLPFALAMAESTKDPDDPVSVVGRKAPDFVPDTFSVSYGDPQTVATVAKRSVKALKLNYRINNGKTKSVGVSEWKGGERYGNENNHYYGEFRGVVRGTRPGDKVKVWFSGERNRRDVSSEPFSYTVKQNTGAKVLVLADEDYKGVNPTYPPGTNAPLYAQQYLNAIRAAGYSADLWDTDADGVPHDLGVLSHYKAIVWYLGDNRYTQDPEDELIDTAGIFGPRELPDIGVAEREQYLTMSVRDFMNEGGKLINMGELAQDGGLLDQIVGGTYYGLNGDETAECAITTGIQGLFDDCLILANDFRQYYLGAWARVGLGGPNLFRGIASPIAGLQANLSGTPTNDLDEAGVYQPTSDVLPPSEVPQFKSQGAAQYDFTGGPFTPVEGTRYAAVVHEDDTYTRLTRTIDLGSVTAAQQPRLEFRMSWNTEPNYDHVLVEAHTVGADDWVTLPDLNGGTTTQLPAECNVGFLLEEHPWLTHYITPGNPCTSKGWNAFTGASSPWRDIAIDLAAFAGKQVEVSISYVSDPGTGGVGAFVDDTKVTTAGGTVLSADGFEGATSLWSIQGEPPGSPPTVGSWVIGPQAVNYFAGTSTSDSLLLGFGLEQVTAPADRTKLIKTALSGLGVR
jgi:hypothetical protein